MDNRHLLISGRPGSGKTYTLCHIAAYYASIDHNVIIFDGSGLLSLSYLKDIFSPEYIDKNITYYSIKEKGEVPVNLFERYNSDASIAEYIFGLLECNLINLPKAKFSQLKSDLTDYLLEGFEIRSFGELYKFKDYYLEKGSRTKLKENLFPVLNDIKEHSLSENTWKEIFSGDTSITIISVLKSESTSSLLKMMLYNLYIYQRKVFENEKAKPLDIFIDELHDDDVKNDTIIKRIIEQGRHWGIGLAAGTHI